jgi:hypothetical protein
MRVGFLGPVILLAIGAYSQSSDSPCITKGETVYRPGEQKVLPPQLQQDRSEDDASRKLKVHAQLELMVNSRGKICEIHILRSDNRDAAESIKEFIDKHWHFKPATRGGEPVAVRVQVNFNLGHD